MKPTLFFGGKYPNSPMRHRSPNKQTLRDLATILGYPVVSNPLIADIYISVDYSAEDEKILRERVNLYKFNVLLRNEPRCVLPSGYSRLALSLHNHVITFGKSETNSNSEVWPQFWTEKSPASQVPESVNQRAVIVNANKLNLSASELYTLRRKCIKRIEYLDLYGDDWNSPVTARIKVAIIEILKSPIKHLISFPFHSRYWFSHWPKTIAPAEKDLVLKKYRVSLIIENELTYLSEKLFDALAAGCIPVYVGPDISKFGIPTALVIQANPSLDSIRQQLDLAFSVDYQVFKKELAQWLNSSEALARHHGETVLGRALAKSIEAYLEYPKKHRM